MNNELTKINFHGKELLATVKDGNVLVPMKPIAEHIGLDWHAQMKRIKRSSVLNSVGVITTLVATDGNKREMVSLPLEYLNGWLFGVSENHVKPEIRDQLITYQKECYKVLHDHFNPVAKMQNQLESNKKQYDELIIYANSIIHRYNDAEKRIFSLKTDLADTTEKLENTSAKLAKLKEKIKPKITLQQLIVSIRKQSGRNKTGAYEIWKEIYQFLKAEHEFDVFEHQETFGSCVEAIDSCGYLAIAYDYYVNNIKE